MGGGEASASSARPTYCESGWRRWSERLPSREAFRELARIDAEPSRRLRTCDQNLARLQPPLRLIKQRPVQKANDQNQIERRIRERQRIAALQVHLQLRRAHLRQRVLVPIYRHHVPAALGKPMRPPPAPASEVERAAGRKGSDDVFDERHRIRMCG